VLFSRELCVCHRHLTPTSPDSVRFLLSDFGFTRSITNTSVGYSSGGWGANGYRAPELIQYQEFSDKTDIWEVGCMLIEIASAGTRVAFKDDIATVMYANEFTETPKLHIEDNPELDASFLLFLNAVLGHCLSRQPEGRPYLYQEFMEWEIMARQDLGIEEARGRSRIRRAVKSLSPMRGPPLPPSPPAYSPAKRRRSQSAGPSSRGSPAGWE
jgi:serine/threonine protein kinase